MTLFFWTHKNIVRHIKRIYWTVSRDTDKYYTNTSIILQNQLTPDNKVKKIDDCYN